MSSPSRRLVLALRLLALLTIALHLAAPSFKESWAWGVWPATYLPAVWRWTLGAAAAALALAGDRISARVLRFVGARSRVPRPSWPVVRLAASALAVVPFYLFRIVHTRWGDAYILVNAIAHPEVRLTYTWMAPLDVFLHAKTWAVGHGLWGWPDAAPAYAFWSCIAGGAFVWVLLGMAHWLGRDRTERWLTVGLVVTLGTMQLFFGYVENYVIVAVGILVYLWLGLRALRGEIPLLWAAGVLALTHAFNPSTLFIAPSLLYLAWRSPLAFPGQDATHPRSFGRGLAAATLPYLAVGLGVIAFMTAGGHGIAALLGADAPGGGDHRWFVPLLRTTTRWEHYVMFSLGHLIDIANEQMLAAPVVCASLVLAAALACQRLPGRDPVFRFLLLVSGLFLVLILTWNADFGGQRDWDLFSLASIPAAVLAAYTLPRVLPERRALVQAGWALVVAQAYHTLAWVYQNTLPWQWPKG